MTHLRDIRSAVSIGLIWSVLWAATAVIAGTIIGLVDPGQIDPGEAPLVLAPAIGLVGFLCGCAFAGLASIPRGAEHLAAVPLTRVVLWGIAVAGVVPVVTGKIIPEVLVIAPLGAVSAMASLTIVRRFAQSAVSS